LLHRPWTCQRASTFILVSAQGGANSAIAARLQLNPVTVRKWRTQFIERRIKGLYS
jgi:transposase-like protein